MTMDEDAFLSVLWLAIIAMIVLGAFFHYIIKVI